MRNSRTVAVGAVAIVVGIGVALIVVQRRGSPGRAPASTRIHTPPKLTDDSDVRAQTFLYGAVTAAGVPRADALVSIAPVRTEVSRPDSLKLVRYHETNRTGDFRFGDLSPGAYRIVAHAPGHLPAAATVRVHADASNRIDLALAEGGSELRGHVMDAGGGPVEGAKLFVRTLGEGDDLSSSNMLLLGVTKSDGQYRFNLERGRYAVEARFVGYAPATGFIEMRGSALQRDFNLFPGATISGRVRKRSDKSVVPHAVVRLEGPDTISTMTGADGSFTFADLEPGTFEISVTKAALCGRTSTINVSPGQSIDGISVLLDHGDSIIGRVVDDTGVGFPGANITLHSDWSRSRVLARATSDSTGSVQLDGIEPGSYRVEASAPGHSTGAQDIFVGGQMNLFSITLNRAARIIGRVVDENGNDLPDAVVSVMLPPGGLN